MQIIQPNVVIGLCLGALGVFLGWALGSNGGVRGAESSGAGGAAKPAKGTAGANLPELRSSGFAIGSEERVVAPAVADSAETMAYPEEDWVEVPTALIEKGRSGQSFTSFLMTTMSDLDEERRRNLAFEMRFLKLSAAQKTRMNEMLSELALDWEEIASENVAVLQQGKLLAGDDSGESDEIWELRPSRERMSRLQKRFSADLVAELGLEKAWLFKAMTQRDVGMLFDSDRYTLKLRGNELEFVTSKWAHTIYGYTLLELNRSSAIGKIATRMERRRAGEKP